PQMRDLQYLITDGRTFFHEEKRHLTPKIERIGSHSLGYRIHSSDPDGHYRLEKEVVAAPHLPVILEHTRFLRTDGSTDPLGLYVLAAPHLGGGGRGNDGYVVETAGREFLAAEAQGTAMAIGSTAPFRRLSTGYVGASDGWTDLKENYRMDFEFDRAPGGNVALMAEVPVDLNPEFTIAVAFGRGLPSAVTSLLQALGEPYVRHRHRFLEQWERPCRDILPLKVRTSDQGTLYHASYSTLLAHEDKTFAGGFIASMSIPWGNAKGDEDRGGYHLVWTRDLYHTAIGLLAAGDKETPLRILIYLAASQQSDGGYPQNFWLNGEGYWQGIQLDEVSFPILLAYRLEKAHGLRHFDPYPMV
ncbi:MAG: glycoside hydrolase family 15 protein, partial [Thermoplasmata archaeon]